MPSFDCPRGRVPARTSAVGRPSATLPLLFIVGAAAAVPAPLVGQTGVVLAAHVGSTAAVPGGVVVVDGASEIRQGLWGLRLGIGMDAAVMTPVLSLNEASSGIWSSDLDDGLNRDAHAGTPVFTWIGVGLAGSTRARTARPARSTGRSGTITGRGADEGEAHRRTSAEEIAAAAIGSAERLIGTPYRWGGASPRAGFDCSGFVQYVFRQQEIELPRVSRNQARAGIPLETSLDGLTKGDLLFFALRGSSADHVAIYAGDDRMVHASSSGRGVRYDDLTSDRGRWYARRLVAVRRVIIEGEVLVPEVPAEEGIPAATRALPLGEPLDAIAGENGDEGAPPPGR